MAAVVDELQVEVVDAGGLGQVVGQPATLLGSEGRRPRGVEAAVGGLPRAHPVPTVDPALRVGLLNRDPAAGGERRGLVRAAEDIVDLGVSDQR